LATRPKSISGDQFLFIAGLDASLARWLKIIGDIIPIRHFLYRRIWQKCRLFYLYFQRSVQLHLLDPENFVKKSLIFTNPSRIPGAWYIIGPTSELGDKESTTLLTTFNLLGKKSFQSLNISNAFDP